MKLSLLQSYVYVIQNKRIEKLVDGRKSHLRIRAAVGRDEKQQFLNSITDGECDYSTSKDLFIAPAESTLYDDNVNEGSS